MKKENFFTHRFLPVFSIIIMCLFTFCINSFASSTVSYTDNIPKSRHYEKKVYFPSFPTDVSNKRYFLAYSNGSLGLYVVREEYKDYVIVDKDKNGYDLFLVKDLNSLTTYGYFDVYYCSCGLNDLLKEETMSAKSWRTPSTTNKIPGYIEEQVYSNTSVYYANGEYYFFMKPVTETATIPALETVQELPTAIMTTLKMIIPIGLIVLSMVLAIYLIKSVILRMK